MIMAPISSLFHCSFLTPRQKIIILRTLGYSWYIRCYSYMLDQKYADLGLCFSCLAFSHQGDHEQQSCTSKIFLIKQSTHSTGTCLTRTTSPPQLLSVTEALAIPWSLHSQVWPVLIGIFIFKKKVAKRRCVSY